MNWINECKQSCAALTTLFLTVAVQADPQSKSYSSWHFVDSRVYATYTIASSELNYLPQPVSGETETRPLTDVLPGTITVHTPAGLCELITVEPRAAAAGYSRAKLAWECRESNGLTISIATLFDYAPSHIHFARFKLPTGQSTELLYTTQQRQHRLGLSEDSASEQSVGVVMDTLLTYGQFGFQHILIGVDHIAFLLTLLLLAPNLREIIFVVTGFTLGHSATLSAAALGVAEPNSHMVEALIGFTIALVAAENIGARIGQSQDIAWIAGGSLALVALFTAFSSTILDPLSVTGLALFTWCYLQLSNSADRARTLRPWMTSLFGLIHGFGFAGVLLEVGLPQQAIMPALLGFNIGVELGQIAIVLALCVTGATCYRFLRPHLDGNSIGRMQDTGSAALCGLGVFWFVQRGLL